MKDDDIRWKQRFQNYEKATEVEELIHVKYYPLLIQSPLYY